MSKFGKNKVAALFGGATILVGGAFVVGHTSATPTSSAVVSDWVLPNSVVTPGATNPDVTQANISQNVCEANWTSTVRPPVSYTDKLKLQQLGGSYVEEVSVFGAIPSGYEEDHLISLQLGGSPTDPKNLWPEPYAGNNARKKDVVETALKRLICSNQITLVEAQKAISTNWVAAYNKYVTSADLKDSNANG